MIDNSYGERIGSDTLRFERLFAAPIERVWSAIVTPEGLAAWLGRATVEPRPGGRFEIDFGEGDRMDGRVLTCEPPHLLLLAWHETHVDVASRHATGDDDESRVRFELTRVDDTSTRLVFSHSLIRTHDRMLSFGAGWHSHLIALAALLAGNVSPDCDELYERLRAPYEAHFAI